MKDILSISVCFLLASIGLCVPAAESTPLSAFLANAWTCLERDIPPDTSNRDLEAARMEMKLVLERMGRRSKILTAQEAAYARAKEKSHREAFRRQARENLDDLVKGAKLVVDFGKRGVPSLDTDVSRNLLKRVLEDLNATRTRIEARAKEEGEPGATDNPGDAQ